jgi:hypothetical protein
MCRAAEYPAQSERCRSRAVIAVRRLDCRLCHNAGSGHRSQRRFDPSVMRGPGWPLRCAGWLPLVWRSRLGPGSQLGAVTWASPGRQRTHMGVGNSQSGSANGPRRDLQNTQHDAIATPTGSLRSRHRRLPIYTVPNGKPLQVSPSRQATLRRRLPSRERGRPGEPSVELGRPGRQVIARRPFRPCSSPRTANAAGC